MGFELAVLLIGSLLGTGGAVGLLRWYSAKEGEANAADDIAVQTAERVLSMVREELEHKAQVERDLRQEINNQTARLNRQQDHINRLEAQRERHMAYVEVLIEVLKEHGITAPPLEGWLNE